MVHSSGQAPGPRISFGSRLLRCARSFRRQHKPAIVTNLSGKVKCPFSRFIGNNPSGRLGPNPVPLPVASKRLVLLRWHRDNPVPQLNLRYISTYGTSPADSSQLITNFDSGGSAEHFVYILLVGGTIPRESPRGLLEKGPGLVAGLDCAFSKDGARIFAAVVVPKVLGSREDRLPGPAAYGLTLLETATASMKVNLPFIPRLPCLGLETREFFA